MMEMGLDNVIHFLNFCVYYYTIQLVRCVLVSFAVFTVAIILRKTILKDKVFLKGALWALFIPVLFAGRLKFFDENRIGLMLSMWWKVITVNHVWICWLYLGVALLYAALLSCKRRKLKKQVAGMEKRELDGTFIFVTGIPVTPSTIGVFRPRIVMPEVILKEYDRKEIQTILLHEKTHICLGHLLFYLLWDILRVLLWLNPLLTIGTKYFREDMEEICDWVTIQKSQGKAWSRDLDGDGVPELICNCTYGDGVQSVIVYRNNNGVIEEGRIRWSYYDEKFGWNNIGESGASSLPVERYDPVRGVFTAIDYYTNGYAIWLPYSIFSFS